MFTLYDGRNQLYQWDLNRKIIVEDTKICEVHFCNRTSDCSLVVEPYYIDNLYVADIPNILLQDARPIRAYAYCDDEYTLTEEQFSVKSRTMPADYVYTETEVLQWSTAMEKIDQAIESIPAQVEDTVNQYIADNPIEVDLSNYYTREETDTAIYNSKDAYYLDFSKATFDKQPATDEMIEFATRFSESQNVCAHIKGDPSFGVVGWSTATVSGTLNKGLTFTTSGITPMHIANGVDVEYPTYAMDYSTEDGWTYYAKANYTFAIATKEYVDNSLENVQVDLTGYATEEYVDNALANVPTGDISITLEDDGEGNVTFVGGTLADGEEVQY